MEWQAFYKKYWPITMRIGLFLRNPPPLFEPSSLSFFFLDWLLTHSQGDISIPACMHSISFKYLRNLQMFSHSSCQLMIVEFGYLVIAPSLFFRLSFLPHYPFTSLTMIGVLLYFFLFVSSTHATELSRGSIALSI